MRLNIKGLSSIALAVGVLALSACGGGGGGSTAAPSTTIGGVASKGLMVGAKVTAYCGVAPTTPIGTATTDGTGNYALTLTQACALPVEVVVSVVEGVTTMIDEVKGSITLPADFTMKAFVPAGSGTITQQITPLTDMAAALVENAGASALSAAVVSNANSAIIANVLGGDATLFTAKPITPAQYSDDTTSEAQKKLVTLLSSISAAAQSQTGQTDGDKMKAVLTQLATQAKATIPTVTATSYTVNTSADTTATTGTNATPLGTIKAGLDSISNGTQVVNGSAEIKNNADLVKAAVVDTSVKAVEKAKTSENGIVTPPDASNLQKAIAAARLLITSFKTNILSLANPDDTGYLQTKLTAANKELTDLALESKYHVTDIVSASQRATAFLVDVNLALAASTEPAFATKGSDTLGDFYSRSFYDGDQSSGATMKCNVYFTRGSAVAVVDGTSRAPQVVGGKPVATCNQFLKNDGVTQTQFIVFSPDIPGAVASGATFAYTNRVRTWTSPSCTSGAKADCTLVSNSTVFATGNLTATWGIDGVLNGVSIAANSGGTGNVLPYLSDKASLVLGYTTSTDDAGVKTVNFNGSLTDGALSYGFLPGTYIKDTPTTVNDVTTHAIEASFLVQAQTAGFQYKGTLTLDGSKGTDTTGTLGFVGSIKSGTGNTATAFLDGNFTGNMATKQVFMGGKITNGDKVNTLSITADGSVTGRQDMTLVYDFPGYSITVNTVSYDDTSIARNVTMTASFGTKMTAIRGGTGADSTIVTDAAGTTIGTLGSNNQLNFIDNSYIVLN